MCLVRCQLLLLLAHCAEYSWSSDNVGSYSAIILIVKYEKNKQGERCLVKKAAKYGRQAPKNTASHSQYCAYGWVAHAQRVGSSVVTMGLGHVVCCVPGICSDGVLTAHERLAAS